MYNHNKAQQSKNRVHISWDILYGYIAWQIHYVAAIKQLLLERGREVGIPMFFVYGGFAFWRR